jgi:hypothetical protein
MIMEHESTDNSGIINWLAKLTRKVTSGKIVPLYYGENLPSHVADSVRDARALWIILLSDSRFDIDGMFANCEKRGSASPSPTHNKRRIMFPCPVHNSLDSESQAEVIRRSKLAQSWGVEVKWVDHEIHESMIIINPPTKDDGNSNDGIAFIDLSLPHLDTAARTKFEITQKDQAKIFSDLVKSFSQTWGKAHDPIFEKEKRERTRIVSKGVFVA